MLGPVQKSSRVECGEHSHTPYHPQPRRMSHHPLPPWAEIHHQNDAVVTNSSSRDPSTVTRTSTTCCSTASCGDVERGESVYGLPAILLECLKAVLCCSRVLKVACCMDRDGGRTINFLDRLEDTREPAGVFDHNSVLEPSRGTATKPAPLVQQQMGFEG